MSSTTFSNIHHLELLNQQYFFCLQSDNFNLQYVRILNEIQWLPLRMKGQGVCPPRPGPTARSLPAPTCCSSLVSGCRQIGTLGRGIGL